MLGIMLTDCVYTPAPEHLRRGDEGACGFCGAEQGDWLHHTNRCAQTPRMQDPGNMPDCLRYTVNILAGWMPGNAGLR